MHKVVVTCKGQNANRGTFSKDYFFADEPNAEHLTTIKEEVKKLHRAIYGGGTLTIDITQRRQ